VVNLKFRKSLEAILVSKSRISIVWYISHDQFLDLTLLRGSSRVYTRHACGKMVTWHDSSVTWLNFVDNFSYLHLRCLGYLSYLSWMWRYVMLLLFFFFLFFRLVESEFSARMSVTKARPSVGRSQLFWSRSIRARSIKPFGVNDRCLHHSVRLSRHWRSIRCIHVSYYFITSDWHECSDWASIKLSGDCNNDCGDLSKCNPRSVISVLLLKFSG